MCISLGVLLFFGYIFSVLFCFSFATFMARRNFFSSSGTFSDFMIFSWIPVLNIGAFLVVLVNHINLKLRVGNQKNMEDYYYDLNRVPMDKRDYSK